MGGRLLVKILPEDYGGGRLSAGVIELVVSARNGIVKGGHVTALRSMRQRGLLDGDVLTDAGHKLRRKLLGRP